MANVLLMAVFAFAFVLAFDVDAGCWWFPWSNPPGLTQRAFARGGWVTQLGGCAAVTMMIYLWWVVSKWVSWQARRYSPGLPSHPHYL